MLRVWTEILMSSVFRFVLLLILASPYIRADVLAAFDETIGPEPVSETTTYPLTIDRPEAPHAIDVQAVLRAGEGELRVTDPNGNEVYRHLWGERLSEELAPLGPLNEAGEYHLVVDVENAVGHWRVRVAEVPGASELRSIALAGPLLAAVGIAFLIIWRFKTRAPWRWFAVGAGVRVVALVFSLPIIFLYYMLLRNALEDALPYSQFLVVNGAATGIAAGIGPVLASVLAGAVLRGSRGSGANAVAVGVGAGVSETLASAVVTMMGTGLLFGGSPKSGKWMLQLAYDATLTPLLPLVEPVKFVCVILCLTAICGLTLRAVAARRWASIVPALLLAVGFYAVLGGAPAWALEGAASKWWTVLGALPFAVVSGIAARHGVREWPQQTGPDEAPMEAFLRGASTDEEHG